MDLFQSGSYIDIFLCQNMCNNKNKHSGGVSCSACNAFIGFVMGQLFVWVFLLFQTVYAYSEGTDKTALSDVQFHLSHDAEEQIRRVFDDNWRIIVISP